MSGFEIVDRPSVRKKAAEAEMDAVVASAATGKAVRIALNGTMLTTWRVRLTGYCARRGLKLCSRADGDAHLIAWAEQLEPK